MGAGDRLWARRGVSPQAGRGDRAPRAVLRGAARSFLAMPVVGACVAVAAHADGSPADLFGVGSRSQAMAATGTAVAQGTDVVYANPALLGGTSEQRLTLGVQAMHHSVAADVPDAQTYRFDDAKSGLTLGLVAPLHLDGAWRERVALGLALYSPRDVIAGARLRFAEEPGFPVLLDRMESLSLHLGVGVRITPDIDVGVGLGMLAGLTGEVDVERDADGVVGTDVRDELEASLAPALGVAWRPAKDWRLGVTWRGALESDVDVTTRLDDLGSLVLPDLSLAGVAQYDPLQLAAEVGLQRGAFTAALGLLYRRWSAFSGSLAETFVCPSAVVECGVRAPPSPGYSDTWTPRLGLAYRLNLPGGGQGELRSGVAYEPSPAPLQTQASNGFDDPRLVSSFGYGVRTDAAGSFSVDVALQYHVLLGREHEKAVSVSADNPGFPEVATSGEVLMVALSAGVAF